MKSHTTECAHRVLTEEKCNPRLGLLNHDWFAGDLSGRFVTAFVTRGGQLPLLAANEQLPGSRFDRLFPSLAVTLPMASRTNQSGKLQDLRANGHDKNQESPGGSPPSGHKKPELFSLVLFTPRHKQHDVPPGDETNTENQSWKCACN